MRKLTLSALAFTAFAGLTSAASAAPIALNSSINYTGVVTAVTPNTINNSTALDFAGTADRFIGTGGTFAGLSCLGNCGTLSDLPNVQVGNQAIANFFSLSGGNAPFTINFDLTSITDIDRSRTNFLDIALTGIFRVTGFDPTPGTAFLSTQRAGGSLTTTFSASAMAVPGPIAGAGLPALLALGGFVWTRRRKATAATA
jgi:LPXTG-motif cell wall-anchored protein